MGLDADTAVPTGDYWIFFNWYTGSFDAFNTGNFIEPYFQSYPAAQSDGTRMWGDARFNRGQLFNPDKQCFDVGWDASEFGLVRTINANGVPDSIRIGIRPKTECWRFAVTTNCGSTLGGYFDNIPSRWSTAP
jgi:hypothetical protein